MRQLPSFRLPTRAKKAVKTEKAVELSETLQVESESRISDDERALLEKLKCLEKHKKKVTLEPKAKLLEVNILRMLITDNIGTGKEVEEGNGGGSRDEVKK